jgi:hypothetical protein
MLYFSDLLGNAGSPVEELKPLVFKRAPRLSSVGHGQYMGGKLSVNIGCQIFFIGNFKSFVFAMFASHGVHFSLHHSTLPDKPPF